MKKLSKLLTICLLAVITIYSCNKKYDGDTSLEDVKYKTNKQTIPSVKMDSAQAINTITKQKIQDLLDLSTLYTSGNRDTEIDSVIYAQMKGYFLNGDSLHLKPLLKDLDSLKVRYAKVNKLEISKVLNGNDSLDFAKFNVEYYDNKKAFIGNYNRQAQYILKASPIQFKKEFKFYFINFYDELKKKDSSKTAVNNHKTVLKSTESKKKK